MNPLKSGSRNSNFELRQLPKDETKEINANNEIESANSKIPHGLHRNK